MIIVLVIASSYLLRWEQHLILVMLYRTRVVEYN
jgi:hypothetical protein